MRRLHVNDAHALPRRLIIIKTSQIFARDQCISLAIFLALRFQHGANRRPPFLQAGREYFELEILLLSALLEFDRELRRFRTPPCGQLQPQHSVDISRVRFLVTPTATVDVEPL